MIAGLAVVVVLAAATGHAAGQSNQPPPGPPPSAGIRILPNGAIETTGADGTRTATPVGPAGLEPLPPPAWVGDAETNARFLASLRGYFDYRASGYEHRRRVFEWQLFSGRVIFVAVLLLVATGMVFAAIQFQRGLARTDAGGPADAATQVEIGASTVKVTSPVLGVVILVISLAFFYLYLVHVYPIREIP